MNPKRILIPLIVLLVVGSLTIWYFYYRPGSSAAAGPLSASGTIETVEVVASPEMSGKVVEIMVGEGDALKAGDGLFRLDDELLQAQRKQAQAALSGAQDNLANAEAGVEAAQEALNSTQASADLTKANAAADLLSAQQKLQDLYDQAEVAKTTAEQALSVATRGVRESHYLLFNYTIPTDQVRLTAMEAVTMTKKRLDQAQAKFEPYKNLPSTNTTREDLKTKVDNAQSDYDSAVRRLELEAALDKATAQQKKALEDLAKLQDGPKAEDVAILEARIAALKLVPIQAEAAVKQAQANLTQAQTRLAQARSAQAQAQAAVDLIDVQIEKLVVRAPADGIILSRSLEPGAVVQPGATVLTIGQLNDLKITVYVPEDRYGEIKLGEKARVTVDSFPGQSFNGVVTYISDKAEFTPRNVQTAEGRRTTVFAVKLSLDSSSGILKPGMPADVIFGN